MIGVFDSGSGGLTVLAALRKKAPSADVIYFGDIKNAPYGLKSPTELSVLTHQGVAYLRREGATALVSACNSVSASILAGAAGDMPFVEMSVPTAAYLQNVAEKRFLLIATPATVASHLYDRAVGSDIALESLAIPDLAGAIEFGRAESELRNILVSAFSPLQGRKYDGLILGCTHYPLIRSLIEETVGTRFGTLEVIDPAYPVAETACRAFPTEGSGKTRFCISQDSTSFRMRVEALFPHTTPTIEVVH